MLCVNSAVSIKGSTLVLACKTFWESPDSRVFRVWQVPKDLHSMVFLKKFSLKGKIQGRGGEESIPG